MLFSCISVDIVFASFTEISYNKIMYSYKLGFHWIFKWHIPIGEMKRKVRFLFEINMEWVKYVQSASFLISWPYSRYTYWLWEKINEDILFYICNPLFLFENKLEEWNIFYSLQNMSRLMLEIMILANITQLQIEWRAIECNKSSRLHEFFESVMITQYWLESIWKYYFNFEYISLSWINWCKRHNKCCGSIVIIM